MTGAAKRRGDRAEREAADLIRDTRAWSFDLPWQSPPLTANQRLHWAPRNTLTQQVRDVGILFARAARIPRLERGVVTLHWQPTTHRRRDDVNPMPTVKAAVDGLVDAGVFADDTHDIVTHRVQIHPVARPGGMWLTVQETPASRRRRDPGLLS